MEYIKKIRKEDLPQAKIEADNCYNLYLKNKAIGKESVAIKNLEYATAYYAKIIELNEAELDRLRKKNEQLAK